MTYAFTQDVPINAEAYAEIRKALGDTLPDGLIAHYAIEKEDGGIRYIDLWESEGHFEAFAATRLHPAVFPVLQRFNIRPQGEPARVPLKVVDAWFGKTAVTAG